MLEGWTAITAIAGIVILMIIALMNGINGVLLSGAIAVIAGLGGFKVGQLFKKGIQSNSNGSR